MQFSELLGRFVTLSVDRFIPAGALLSEQGAEGDEPPALLLPKSEVPEGTHEGDSLEVFVYLDSDDRPIATLRTPKIALGEVTFLEVMDLNDVGAFVDWGLVKQLFVPFREQTVGLRTGHRYPFGLYLDSSERLAGTMRIRELLSDTGDFTLDEWIEGEVWRFEEGIGTFVILERAFLGLIPAFEPTQLERGDAVRVRVANILADGKIELSLRGKAHEEVGGDANRVLEVVVKTGTLVGDSSSPDEVRNVFGLSKKAFKRAVGLLLRRRVIALREDGSIQVIGKVSFSSNPAPSAPSKTVTPSQPVVPNKPAATGSKPKPTSQSGRAGYAGGGRPGKPSNGPRRGPSGGPSGGAGGKPGGGARRPSGPKKPGPPRSK